MADQRLTREELSWLLAQEARGAARALRDGVSQLAPPDPKAVPAASVPAVQLSLDALDGAIDALNQLQAHPTGSGRRGRLDVASLLLQLTPNARIAIEPGGGTEVYGDEGQLRRMLYVMLSQSSNPTDGLEATAPEIQVRREGPLVRLSVALGPDQSATAELERRWLNRMAVRMGGRLELEGGDQALLLPADGASVQHEVDELRRELEQARQLGEAYARELAEVFTAGVASSSSPEAPSAAVPTVVGEARFELLQSLSAALARRLRPVLDGMGPELDKLRQKLGEGSQPVQLLQQRHTSLREVVGELNRVAKASPTSATGTVSPQELVQEVMRGAERRAARHGVRLNLDTKPCQGEVAVSPVLSLLLRCLLDHAIAATPQAGEVTLSLEESPSGTIGISVRDGGPSVLARARDDLLLHRVDPTSMGRPAGVTLLVAHAAAQILDAALVLREGPQREFEVFVALPTAAR